MKSEVEYKKYDLPHFLIQIKELIDEQEKEVERAVLSIGSVSLKMIIGTLWSLRPNGL